MSKIGKKSILIPEGVEVTIQGPTVRVKGPKGELSYDILPGVAVKQEENSLNVSIQNEEIRNLRGLTRTLIANMVEGVTQGYEKKLLVMGVGYGAKLQGTQLELSLGLSHKVHFPIPQNIQASVEENAKGNAIVTLQCIDKQFLGQTAAKIRAFRKPEPYKGKGIRYIDEVVKIKAGKTAKK